jgi:hypothetical protein
MIAKRAILLKKTLDFFNYYGELELADPEDDNSMSPELHHLHALLRSLQDDVATRVAKERTELVGYEQPIDPVEKTDSIPTVPQADLLSSASLEEDGDEDSLDHYYSGEVVEKLPEMLRRASHLSPLRINTNKGLPSDVERYFCEAHQCYLYGFPVACAVLCRAILEASLRMRLPGKFPDLADRIEEAHAKGMLSQECRVWAYEVKDTGNNAIHQYERFAKGDLSDKVEECLIKTRTIVEELLVGRDSFN